MFSGVLNSNNKDSFQVLLKLQNNSSNDVQYKRMAFMSFWWQQKPRSACAFVQSDQGLGCHFYKIMGTIEYNSLHAG